MVQRPLTSIPTFHRANFCAQVQHFRQFQGSNLPTSSRVVGLAPGHFCAQVHHWRQFLWSSLPNFSCVVGLAPGHFCAQASTFASFCGPARLLFSCVVGLAPGHFCAQVQHFSLFCLWPKSTKHAHSHLASSQLFHTGTSLPLALFLAQVH